LIEIDLICIGTLKEKYLKDACAEYAKRLSRFCKLNLIELSESDLKKEGAEILKRLKGYTVALCVEGKQISSEELSEKLEALSMNYSAVTFVIGSSTGLSDEVKQRADMRLSFSKMTFPHQLMRVIALEQIYRAFTISKNITYHK